MLRAFFCLAILANLAAATPPDAGLQLRLQQEAIAFAERQSEHLPGTYSVRALRPPTLPNLRAGSLRIEASHLSKREPTGQFFAVFRIFVDDRLAGSTRVDLEGAWQGTLLKTRRALTPKTMLTEELVEVFNSEGIPPPGALSELPASHRLRRALPPGTILTQADIEPIPMVSPGDPLRLTLDSGALSVRIQATARGRAALGEPVNLELPGRRHLRAMVTGPGEARLTWPGEHP